MAQSEQKSGPRWTDVCAICGEPATHWCAGCDTEFCCECGQEHETKNPCDHAKTHSVDSKEAIEDWMDGWRRMAGR